jgi:hypothetical protein
MRDLFRDSYQLIDRSLGPPHAVFYAKGSVIRKLCEFTNKSFEASLVESKRNAEEMYKKILIV